MSIRLRLAALFTLATLAILGVGGYLYLAQLSQGIQASLDQSLDATATAVTSDLAASPTDTTLPEGHGALDQLYASNGALLDTPPALSGRRLLSAAQAAAAASGTTVRFDSSIVVRGTDENGTEGVRVLAVRASGHRVVAVAVERDLLDDAAHQATMKLIVLGAVVIVLAAPGSWLLARAALRPVERMRAQAAKLEAENAAEGIAVPGTRDEISRLGLTFNALLGRLHEALAREQSFVADAGHELRTPLTVLKGELQLAGRPGRSTAELREAVQVAETETDRLIRLTENLLVLARDAKPAPEPIDLADLVYEAIGALAARAADAGVRVEVAADESPTVHADRARLRQVLDNLLSNAVRHAPRDSMVTIGLGADGDDAVVTVTDRGPGFPPDFLPVAFDRFTRADTARSRADSAASGHGLGLAIVAAIMTAHGGSAVAENAPDGGAVITLRWPRRTGAATGAHRA